MTNNGNLIEEAKQITLARGSVYQLLARCFYPPTGELLEDLDHGPSSTLMKSLLSTFQCGTLAEMLTPGKNELSSENQPGDLLLPSLKQEYLRLFQGPGHVQVPPYESVHRKDVPEIEMGLVMGAATLDAKRRYAEAGVAVAKDFTDLPDHIAVELEFMYYLCARQADSSGSEMEDKFVVAQREFLAEHFNKWLPDFCDAVFTTSNLHFYQYLARVTQAFFESEIAEMLEKDTHN